jgi:hypothetical protein
VVIESWKNDSYAKTDLGNMIFQSTFNFSPPVLGRKRPKTEIKAVLIHALDASSRFIVAVFIRRWANANQVAVTMHIIDAADRAPVFVLA